MDIFVQTWTERIIKLKVKSSDTIGNVKSKLSDEINIAPEEQILSYKDQILINEYTLSDHKIPEEATLRVQPKIRG